VLHAEFTRGYVEDVASTVYCFPMDSENPYFALHREFREAGARVLLSSGQACVAYGIAAFSKDGDWIVREDAESCDRVREVLARHGASYRLGVPLTPQWLATGLTSHFEFVKDGVRIRTDFCSRPPRVTDLARLWGDHVRAGALDLVDAESLIVLKQTRRQRDYSIIGALAESAGLNSDWPELALRHLQDVDLLLEAVERWPETARQSARPAVQEAVRQRPRSAVVVALALEQDELVQRDAARVKAIQARLVDYAPAFVRARARWRADQVPLRGQHEVLLVLADRHLGSSA